MGRSCLLALLFAMVGAFCYSTNGNIDWAFSNGFYSSTVKDSLEWADYYYNIGEYKRAISIYRKKLNGSRSENIYALKKLALSEAALNHSSTAMAYVSDYFVLEFNPNFLLNERFDVIRKSAEFKRVSEKVLPKIKTWSLIYLFVAIIGFYVVFTLIINKQIHKTSRLLIASFIFIHSLFILNISVNRSNYMFEFPHTYLMSTWASFLYGPLLYFYLKTTSQKYAFRKIDLLHIVPTILLLGYLTFGVYLISAEGKIQFMLSRISSGLNPQDSSRLLLLVILKVLSLTIYGFFIRKVYLKEVKEKLLEAKKLIWHKNVYQIHILYVITYSAYGILVVNQINSGFIYDASTAAMALMVLYVGYSANIQPDVFNGVYDYKNRLFPKYEKSGLTPSLSNELRENLIHLFEVDKIYKENSINLDMVAQRLNTTRHNASQIINEHFSVSFHEFVNMHRIKEAKELLLEDKSQRLNIINVAYEVGYNNKVTFNKAFKKDTNLTPSQYQKSAIRV
ncbi:MAG: helix-turn-helix domain-containing protein [Allomuricauda sp.]